MKAVLNLLARASREAGRLYDDAAAKVRSVWTMFKGTRFYSQETAIGALKVLVFPAGAAVDWYYAAPLLDAPSSGAKACVVAIMVPMICFSVYFGVFGLIDIFTDHRLREARNKVIANQLIESGQAAV